MSRFIVALAIVTTGVAPGCGDPVPKPLGERGPGGSLWEPAESGGDFSLSAENYTPGYFRDTYRLLDAQAGLDASTAAERLAIDLQRRLLNPGALPDMLGDDRATLDGLLMLALRSVQATNSNPEVARTLGHELLHRSLGLDPALDAYAQEGRAVAPLIPGPTALASAMDWSLRQSTQGQPSLCSQVAYSTGTSWDPGEPEVVWVDGYCEPDQWVGGYCESDLWIEGECYDEWVPEECTGGDWIDRGYYEYYCYDEYDCRYIWREYWVYEDGVCTGGYYEQWCDNGYWEQGLCYEGTFVPGYCEDGHYQYRYPGGTWSFPAFATAPESCETGRPAQYAIAVSSAQILAAQVYEDLDPQWQAALDDLLARQDLETPNDATLDAVHQILAAILVP